MKDNIKNCSTRELDMIIDKITYNWMKAIMYQEFKKIHPTYLPRYQRRRIK